MQKSFAFLLHGNELMLLCGLSFRVMFTSTSPFIGLFQIDPAQLQLPWIRTERQIMQKPSISIRS
jgi:hypothetical protein